MSVSAYFRRNFNRLCPILLLLGAYWAYGAYERHRLRSYGAPYNPVRQRLGLPLVGADWQEVRSDDAIDFVNPNSKAAHTRKRVVVSWKGVVEEADLVILPMEKGTLDMIYNGRGGASSATLYKAHSAVQMPYMQAIDTLKKYHLGP
ncbi:hypothetical protein [Hymenobacter lapidiphilus]|uniref:Uncharacterized protein n=1 Tax=Hymenobacter lapidiphilus TaxID=2608003 RepID=A0A7Y7PRR5_9BACT|nr:hypothetical protein [Hymenobacter lapidiphilus]NVO32845.1 hypothetical protein [Hymenobacter lapidiphilus]